MDLELEMPFFFFKNKRDEPTWTKQGKNMNSLEAGKIHHDASV